MSERVIKTDISEYDIHLHMQMVPPSENHNERFNLLRVFLDFFTLTRFFYLIKPASS